MRAAIELEALLGLDWLLPLIELGALTAGLSGLMPMSSLYLDFASNVSTSAPSLTDVAKRFAENTYRKICRLHTRY